MQLSVCTHVPVQAIPHFLPDAVTWPPADTSTNWQNIKTAGRLVKKRCLGIAPYRLGKNKLHELRGVKFCEKIFCQICEIFCQIWIRERAN